MGRWLVLTVGGVIACGGLTAESTGPDGGIADGASDTKLDTFTVLDAPLPDTCNAGREDCANGLDDNCNNLVDCADPDCLGSGYSCTVSPPMGWMGPISYAEAMGTPASCVVPYAGAAVDAHAGALTASQATCGCTCQGPMGQSCGNATASIWDGYKSCTVSCGGTVSIPPNGCVNLNCSLPAPPTKYVSAIIPQFAPTGGSCAPQPTQNVPPPLWSLATRTCAYSLAIEQGGCPPSQFCVAGAPAPRVGPCVVSPGDLACPAGYPTKHLTYDGVNDSRGCSACSCNLSGGNCSGGVNFYAGANCTDTILSSKGLGNICSIVSNGWANPLSATPNPPNWMLAKGTCSAQGGQPEGSVTAASPVTVCCK